MTENTPYSFKKFAMPILVISLLLIVAAQLWFMADMKQQLNSIKNSTQAATANLRPLDVDTLAKSGTSAASPQPSVPQTQSLAQSPVQSPLANNFFNQLFSADAQVMDQQFEDIRRQMEQLMQQAFSNAGANHGVNSSGIQKLFGDSSMTPDIKIEDEGKQYLVLVDLPGADKDNISVSLNDNMLTVSGRQNHHESKTDSAGNTISQSQISGSFSRSVNLPGEVKPGSMHTEYNNDVLKITVTKAA